jgi:hypothetical protein
VLQPVPFRESYDWRYGTSPNDWDHGINPRNSMGPSGKWVWGAENKENIGLRTHNLGAGTVSTK